MDYKEFLKLAEKCIRNRVIIGGGSFITYRNCVDTFKKEHLDVVEQYGLTDSELFVMFMMVMKNYSDIQEQFFPPYSTNAFARKCAGLFDDFLKKIPISSNSEFYRRDGYCRLGNFRKGGVYYCEHFLTASITRSIFDKHTYGIKFVIIRRLIGDSKSHEIFKIYNVYDEYQVNFERNTKFRVEDVDIKDKTVYLKEL